MKINNVLFSKKQVPYQNVANKVLNFIWDNIYGSENNCLTICLPFGDILCEISCYTINHYDDREIVIRSPKLFLGNIKANSRRIIGSKFYREWENITNASALNRLIMALNIEENEP